MRDLIKRGLIFSIPFVVFAAVTVVADPFCYFHQGRAVSRQIKLETSALLQPSLWKLANYRGEPSPHILLGDSRMDSLDVEHIEELTGRRYANLGMLGTSFNEIIETFWHADRTTELESVTIGLNLNIYNDSHVEDRVDHARRLLENPFVYMVDWTVVRALYYNLSSALFDVKHRIGNPPMGPELFWDYMLERQGDAMYADYSHPEQRYQDLAFIAEHCDREGIELTFVIFPEHRDMQQKVVEFGLEGADERFRAELRALGPLHDFNLSGPLTEDRANFKDPIHFTDEIGDWIARLVWTGDGERPSQEIVRAGPSMQERLRSRARGPRSIAAAE